MSTKKIVDKEKYRQGKSRQSKMSTEQNVDRAKCRQSKMSTEQNVDRAKCRQSKTSTGKKMSKVEKNKIELRKVIFYTKLHINKKKNRH